MILNHVDNVRHYPGATRGPSSVLFAFGPQPGAPGHPALSPSMLISCRQSSAWGQEFPPASESDMSGCISPARIKTSLPDKDSIRRSGDGLGVPLDSLSQPRPKPPVARSALSQSASPNLDPSIGPPMSRYPDYLQRFISPLAKRADASAMKAVTPGYICILVIGDQAHHHHRHFVGCMLIRVPQKQVGIDNLRLLISYTPTYSKAELHCNQRNCRGMIRW